MSLLITLWFFSIVMLICASKTVIYAITRGITVGFKVIFAIFLICVISFVLYTFLLPYRIFNLKKKELYLTNEKNIKAGYTYRLNDYFIIKRKNKKWWLYTQIDFVEFFLNMELYLNGNSKVIKTRFATSLKELQYQLSDWFEKCDYDIHIKTNHIMLKRIAKAEKLKLFSIKAMSKTMPQLQLIEHLCLYNKKIKLMKMYKLIISAPNTF